MRRRQQQQAREEEPALSSAERLLREQLDTPLLRDVLRYVPHVLSFEDRWGPEAHTSRTKAQHMKHWMGAASLSSHETGDGCCLHQLWTSAL